MAGPWYVDPENGLTTNNGLSDSTPWKLIPGQTGASSQTGYGVVAGDTINVKNGTTSSLAVALPANNLTYRGYGVASNVLMLTLPGIGGATRTERVVRQAGTHEGMWTLDAAGASTYGFLDFSARSGCVVEDVEVLAPLSDTPVAMGASGSTAIGVTLRRSKVSGSSATGIAVYARSLTIEDVLVEDIDDDGITIGATAANGYRAGYQDVIRRLSMQRVGKDETVALGDGIQTFATSDRFESSLVIQDIYINKPSPVKQAVVFSDMLGGLLMEKFLFVSTTDGHAQILFSGLGGSAVIRNGYIKNGCADNAAIRISGTQGVETGAVLSVSGVVVDAAENSGFFTFGGSESACTIDGAIRINNCEILGSNAQAYSFSGGISVHAGALVTIGANASLLACNNIIECTGQPAARLPVGGANDARWVIRNNVADDMTWSIGSTDYVSVSAFQSAHSYATGNFDYYLSPALKATAGTYVQGVTLRNGRMRPNATPVGAYLALTPRTART